VTVTHKRQADKNKMNDDKRNIMERFEKSENPGASAGRVQKIVMPLVLKKKWFDMILSGEKTEEYREIKDYWARRFLYSTEQGGLEWGAWVEMWEDLCHPFNRHNGPGDLMRYFCVEFKHFDIIHFKNGYNKNAPEFKIEFNGFKVKPGRSEWGAEDGKYYFALQLGKVLEV